MRQHMAFLFMIYMLNSVAGAPHNEAREFTASLVQQRPSTAEIRRHHVAARHLRNFGHDGEKTAVFRDHDSATVIKTKQQIVVEDHRAPKLNAKDEEEEYEEIVYYEEYDEDTPGVTTQSSRTYAASSTLSTSNSAAPTPSADVFATTTAEAATSDTEIINTLLNKGYDWRVRPPGTNLSIPGSHGPVVVSVNMLIRSISKIDDVNMEYSVQMTFRESWVDGRLAYGLPRDGKPDFIILTAGQQIWMPDSFFQNEKQAQKHMIDKPNVLIRVHKDGLILYSVRISLVLSCPMHLQYYPMDVQTCLIDLASYAYTSDDIEYQWKTDKPIQLKDGLESSLPSFQLGRVNTTYCTSKTTTGSYSCLRTVLTLRRQFSYYLLQFYIPSTMLVIVSWVSFWLDRTAVPARVTLGVTTLLTMTTQASGINAKLPPVSYSKAIDIWCEACLTFIFSALLEFACVTYISSRMFYKSKKSPAFQGFASMGMNTSAFGGALTLAPPRMASIDTPGITTKESNITEHVNGEQTVLRDSMPSTIETQTIFQRRNPTKSEPLVLLNYNAVEHDTDEDEIWIRRNSSSTPLSPMAAASPSSDQSPKLTAPPPLTAIVSSSNITSPNGTYGGFPLKVASSFSALNSPHSFSSAGAALSSINTTALLSSQPTAVTSTTYRTTIATEFTDHGTNMPRPTCIAHFNETSEGGSTKIPTCDLNCGDEERTQLFQKTRCFTRASVVYRRRASTMLNMSRGWLSDTFLCRWLARQLDVEDRAKRADYISRVMFPVVFLIFNVIYWMRYSRYQITLPWS